MRYTTAITRFMKEYEKALADKTVRKPISYAMYKTWRWCDTYEKEKK